MTCVVTEDAASPSADAEESRVVCHSETSPDH